MSQTIMFVLQFEIAIINLFVIIWWLAIAPNRSKPVKNNANGIAPKFGLQQKVFCILDGVICQCKIAAIMIEADSHRVDFKYYIRNSDNSLLPFHDENRIYATYEKAEKALVKQRGAK